MHCPHCGQPYTHATVAYGDPPHAAANPLTYAWQTFEFKSGAFLPSTATIVPMTGDTKHTVPQWGPPPEFKTTTGG